MTDVIAKAGLSVAELTSAAQARVLFAHQSVGRNILGAVPLVYREAGIPAAEVVQSPAPVSPARPCLTHVPVGRNRDPLGKLREFAELLDGPFSGSLDVAIIKLCYADVDADTDVDTLFEAYGSTMDGLARRHPELNLIYATVPLTTDRGWKARVKAVLGRDRRNGPADNVARYRYNTKVRQKYGDSGRLFDIAAVEATLATEPMLRRRRTESYEVLNAALSSDSGHLNERGSWAAAVALLRAIAASVAPR